MSTEQQAGPLGEGMGYTKPDIIINELPLEILNNRTSLLGYVQYQANVQHTVNLINTGQIIPYGDFGEDVVYWFQTFENTLGNLVYTVFDRDTTIGIASYSVRFGSAATIGQVLRQTAGKGEVALQYGILPALPNQTPINGQVVP